MSGTKVAVLSGAVKRNTMDGQSGVDLEPIPAGQYDFLPLDKVAFGPGSVEQLPDEIDRLGCKRVFVVAGSALAGSSALGRVDDVLGARLAGTFSGVRRHVPAQTVVDTVKALEDACADLVVTLGDDAALDTAKAAILAAARDTGQFFPHIALPTGLSGAEASPEFAVTDEETMTISGASNPFVLPRVVILDVTLTEATPDREWLASGVTALQNAVETVYAPNHQPATDATALEAIRLLFRHLSDSTLDRPVREPARQQCQVAGWLSMFGVANITLGLSHAISREIAPHYGVCEGEVAAAVLPRVMSYLLPATRARQALIATAAGVDLQGKAETEVALEAPHAILTLAEHVGLPTRLRDLSIPDEELSDLSAGRDDVMHVLRESW